MDKQRSLSLSKVDLETAVARANGLLPDANAGDPSALRDLRTILEDHPQLWDGIGNLERVMHFSAGKALTTPILRRSWRTFADDARPKGARSGLGLPERLISGTLMASGPFNDSASSPQVHNRL